MLFALLALLVIAIDQAAKYYVDTHFYVGESVPVIQNIFHWTYVQNPGAAFGLFEGQRFFFLAVACAVIVGAWYFRKDILALGCWGSYGATLFVGGAIGNLIDRARQGLVIDFFDFRIWPVFNVADIAICVGVAMVLYVVLREELSS